MSDCDICNDFKLLEKATCDEKSYRWSVLKSLCYLITLLETEEATLSPTTTILPSVSKTAAQIEASYTSFGTVGLIDTTKKLNSIRVFNNTDADLEFSYDGGETTAFIVPSGTTYQEQLNITLSTSTGLRMRKVGTAGFGTVYIEGRYTS